MKNKIAILFLILIGISFYALTLRGVFGNLDSPDEYSALTSPTKPFESSHERAPYVQLLAMVQDNSFDITKKQADFAAPDVGYYEGKFYSFFPPGVSAFMIPFYYLGSAYNLGQLFAYASIALLSVFSLILIFKISRNIFRLPVWVSIVAAIIYAFASTSWSYAVTIYQHAPTVFLLLFAFYAAWKYKTSQRFGVLWGVGVGSSYGISIFIDYPNAILFLPVVLYFIYSSFRIADGNGSYRFSFKLAALPALLAFLIFAGLHMYYNYKSFGDYFRFTNTLPRYQIENYDELVGVDTSAIAEQKSEISRIFREYNIPRSFYELTVAPDKGMFFFSPILLLGLLGMYMMRRKFNPEATALAGIFVVNLFLYSSFSDPYGGWAYGPRYLVPSMAALAIFAAIGIYKLKDYLIWRISALLIFSYSSVIALLGTITTNAVPPKVEADFLGIKYGVLYNFDFFERNQSSSFLYNTYFSHSLSLPEYFVLIWAALLLITLVVLFILPKFEHES